MNELFNANSPLMRLLTRVADVMLLNLIFIGTSLPVVTLGASLTALNDTAMKIVADDHPSPLEDYLASFKQNFRQGSVLGLIVLGLAAVVAAWFVVLANLEISAMVLFILNAVLYFVTFRFVIAVFYIFPYQATFEDNLRTVLKNARLISLKHLFSSLVVLAVTALPVVITIFYPKLVGYGLVWFLFGFAAIACVNAVVFRQVFSRYIPSEPIAADPVTVTSP
ncbi:MAG: DUF624 domain-containing protein [Propionibacteriaceae bacterium]|nr:DUF624 domain-containing protein [Propionibacteriaceae bacterium]